MIEFQFELNSVEPNTIPMKNLEIGETFIFHNGLMFMVASVEDSKFNAVSLNETYGIGNVCRVNEDQEVFRVNLKAIVTDA